MNCSCQGCPGSYENRLIDQTYRVRGELIVISEIPAEVCSICGDTLLTPETVRKIDDLIQHHGNPQEAAPVYKLAAG